MTASLDECQHVELLGAELYSDNYWQQLFFLPAMSGLKVTISLNVPRVDDVKHETKWSAVLYHNTDSGYCSRA